MLSYWKGSQLFKYDGLYQYQGSMAIDEKVFLNKDLKLYFIITDFVQSFDIDPSKIDMHIESILNKYD